MSSLLPPHTSDSHSPLMSIFSSFTFHFSQVICFDGIQCNQKEIAVRDIFLHLHRPSSPISKSHLDCASSINYAIQYLYSQEASPKTVISAISFAQNTVIPLLIGRKDFVFSGEWNQTFVEREGLQLLFNMLSTATMRRSDVCEAVLQLMVIRCVKRILNTRVNTFVHSNTA